MINATVGAINKALAWEIDFQFFIEVLTKDWPNTEVSISIADEDFGIDEGLPIAEFSLAFKNEQWVDCLFTGKSLFLWGEEEHYAEVAIWYRSLVPKEQKLYFWTDGAVDEAIEIEANMSAEELAEKKGWL